MQVYRVKEKKEGSQPTASLEKAKANAAIQIGDVKVVVQDSGKRLMVFGKSASSPIQKSAMANDHVASSSSTANKYHQPRWCPPGLSHTKNRKLQRLRNKEKKELEAEKIRDEHFNKYRPMIPQGKVWQAKTIDQPSERPVEPTPATGQTGSLDRSDRLSPVQRAQPNQRCLFQFLELMKWNQLLQRKKRNWWIMRRPRSATIWRSTLCICLRIIS